MNQLREMLQMVTDNRYLAATGIILASLLAAVLVDFIVARFCRVMARRTSTDVDDRLIDLLHRPVRMTVLMVGLWLATERLSLPVRPTGMVVATLQTIAVLVWTTFAFRFVSIILFQLSRSNGFAAVEPRTRLLFDNLSRIILFGVAVYFIFQFWGINVTAWLASAGIIGIAVGFAAKDTLANFFAGIFILADAPYEVGHFINLDTGERGEVVHVGLRSTRLLTRDDVEVTIPNSVMANAKIVNETGGQSSKERIRVKVGVAYGSDVDRLREVLVEVGVQCKLTCDTPESRVRFRGFGNSSIDFELLCWIDEPVLRGRVLDALYTAIYKRLAEEAIEIPFPKRDVYIRQMPPIATETPPRA